jgi:MSHA biogenesis protein MshJ
MNALKQRWQVWAIRIDSLSFRERILAFLAVTGVALSLMFVGLIEPDLKRQALMQQTVLDLEQDMLGLREQIARGEQKNQSGQDSELNRLQQQAEALKQEVRARESGLIEPARMIPALKSLLAEQPGLTLLALETEGVRPALAGPDGAATPLPPAETFYKHGVTLRVQGSYASLTDYITRIEGLPWTMQWDKLRIDASQHPKLELTLKLNTLSREPTWGRL